MSGYHDVNRNPPWTKMGNAIHKTCWDCKHLQVSSFPSRRCPVHPDAYIYGAGPPEREVQDNGSTVADNCTDYTEAPLP